MNGEEDRAIETMKKIIVQNPNHVDALNFIGYSYAEMGINLDEAEMLVKKALSLSPNRGYIIDSLGWVYYKKGDLDRALEHLNKAVKLTSDDPTIMEHLGDIYRDKGNTLRALEFYERGLELNAGDDEKIRQRLEEKISMLKQHLNVQSRETRI